MTALKWDPRDTAHLSGSNHKLNTIGLSRFTSTIKNLKLLAKNKFGVTTLKEYLTGKSPESLASLHGRSCTQLTSLKKDLGLLKMNNASKTIIVRRTLNDDVPFLFATYLKHNWYDKRNSTMLPKMVWTLAQRKKLSKIIEEQKVRVACLSDDPDIILGYGFMDNDKKPFVYVKLAWRNSPYKIEELLTTTIEKDDHEKT